MQDTQLSQISNFIWGFADDLLRDLYVRGKYRDVILAQAPLAIKTSTNPETA